MNADSSGEDDSDDEDENMKVHTETHDMVRNSLILYVKICWNCCFKKIHNEFMRIIVSEPLPWLFMHIIYVSALCIKKGLSFNEF